MKRLARFIYSIFSDAAELKGSMADFARGSFNLMPLGLRQYRPFRNLLAAGNGARRMFQIKDGWGGLDDAINPDTGLAQEASGSLFSTIADILVYIGHGQVSVDGANVPGAIATSLLQLLLKWNGSYTATESGPFTVGLIQPSAPEVGILDTDIGGTPTTSGTYTFRSARLRGATGGKSRASEISKILTLNGKAAYIVAPLPATGQTVHPFFVTTRGLGGSGLHYRIPNANPFTNLEYTEDDIDRTIHTLSVTNASNTVTSPVAEFTQADVGKRFQPLGADITVPYSTKVLTVNDLGTSLTLSNPVTVASGSNPRSARLISFVANIDRAVILNWKESDLAGEAAEISWIYDFPPPSGSHAFQLGPRLAVVSHADSRAEASATNTGTALIFSLANQLESFDLRFPLYLPGGFVDVLGRGLDSYSFVGCRNGIYAVQFINSDTIPATISVMLPNEGIATPNNWAISKRYLYICTGDGKMTRIGENGAQEALFYEPIRRYIQHWSQENTVITADPQNDGTVFSHLGEVLYLDEQTGRWSTPLWLRDSSATGNIVSGIGVRSELILTLEEGDDRNAYKFDKSAGSFVIGTSAYVSSDGEREMLIQQISTKFAADQIHKPAFIALHRNNLKTYLDDGAILSGTNLLNTSQPTFSSEFLGSYVLVKGAAASGGWLWARIRAVNSPTQVQLGTITEDLSQSVAFNASTTVSGAYVLLAQSVFPVKANRAGTIQAISPEIYLNGCHSIAASMLLTTTGEFAHPMEIELSGDEMGEIWNNPVATWGAL